MHIAQLLFSYHGRISRKVWWISQILVWVFATATTLIYHKFGFHDAVFGALLTLLMFMMRLFINIKRLHDQGMSGWWLLLFEIPVIGWIAGFIVLGCRGGHDGENQHGEPVYTVSLSSAKNTVSLSSTKNIVPLLLLCVFIAGCAGAVAVEEFATSEAGITTIELATLLFKKVVALHEAGVDQLVLDEVHDAIDTAHNIIDKHHSEHVGDK